MIRRALVLVVVPVLFGYSLGACLTGCQDVRDPSDALTKCRAEARAAHFVGKKSVEEAFAVYEACKRREGAE